jgi:positive regulator of sigma E activity
VPFAVYMIGFLLFMAVVVWAAVVVGVPQLYITFGALVLIAIGALVAVGRSRTRHRHHQQR